MGLEKQITYDHHIGEDATIFSRRITRLVEDGRQIAKVYHKFTILPGMSADDAGLDVEDIRGRGLISHIHTNNVIRDFKLKG